MEGFLPHTNVLERGNAGGMLRIQDADAQTAEMGGDFRSNVAVFGPLLRRIAFVRKVLTKYGPTPVFATGGVIGTDELPDRRRFVHAAILARTEGHASRNERFVRRKLVPSFSGEDKRDQKQISMS